MMMKVMMIAQQEVRLIDDREEGKNGEEGRGEEK